MNHKNVLQLLLHTASKLGSDADSPAVPFAKRGWFRFSGSVDFLPDCFLIFSFIFFNEGAPLV